MGQQTIERSGSACIIFDIREFTTTKLPEVVQSKWQPFKLRAAAERSHSIRTAAHRIYSSLEVGNEASDVERPAVSPGRSGYESSTGNVHQ
jgi:hypothetical protein